MFRFAHPDFLYLLFILPVLIAFYVYAMILKKKAIKKYGNPELLAELMPEVSPKRQHLKFWLLFGAITMVIFVIAGPQFGSKLETVKRQGVEIMVCLDVSNSMLAEDVSPNRLEKAKQMLSRLTDGFKDDKMGLIVLQVMHLPSYRSLPIIFRRRCSCHPSTRRWFRHRARLSVLPLIWLCARLLRAKHRIKQLS